MALVLQIKFHIGHCVMRTKLGVRSQNLTHRFKLELPLLSYSGNVIRYVVDVALCSAQLVLRQVTNREYTIFVLDQATLAHSAWPSLCDRQSASLLAMAMVMTTAGEGMVTVGPVKPKFYYDDFYRNFATGKFMDTNRESRRRDLCHGLS